MREPSRENVLSSLGSGVRNGITIGELVLRACLVPGEMVVPHHVSAALQRQVRHIIEAARTSGERICATPETGYFIAENDEELNRTCAFLYARALTSLKQIAAMKRVALPDLRGQLQLPL